MGLWTAVSEMFFQLHTLLSNMWRSYSAV